MEIWIIKYYSGYWYKSKSLSNLNIYVHTIQNYGTFLLNISNDRSNAIMLFKVSKILQQNKFLNKYILMIHLVIRRFLNGIFNFAPAQLYSVANLFVNICFIIYEIRSWLSLPPKRLNCLVCKI